ncbi:MAG: B12-binding domain-containing radical SAM protein [Candidatus Anammoxibacter sp.]
METNTSKKTFVFVNLSINSGFYGANHGVAYLVPIVKKNSFNVVFIDMANDITEEEFKKQIEDLNPSIVGFSFTSLQTKYLIKYSKAIENITDCLQIAGGVGATLDPKGILPQTAVDGFVIGEGEIPLDSLLKTINNGEDIYNTEGICWHKDGKIIKTGTPQFTRDLDQLDFPDYSIFERDLVITGTSMNLNIMLSRGCPYSCTYCSNSAIREVYSNYNGYFRMPSVEFCINLVKDTVKQYPETQFISFEDDLLIAKKEWFLSFADEYRKQIGIPYRANVRTECINDEIIKALKDSGCAVGFLGLESGNEQIRKTLLKRHHSNEMLIERALMVKDAGIKLNTFNMVGLPYETKENMQETLELNRKIKADFGICTFFCPFPGTELYEICKREGMLKEDHLRDLVNNFNTSPFLHQASQKKEDCIKAHKRINNFLKWQELISKHDEFKTKHTTSKSILHLLRLLVIYSLHRFSSPYAENSLFSRLARSKFQKRISALIR